jgi:hypothetical protein
MSIEDLKIPLDAFNPEGPGHHSSAQAMPDAHNRDLGEDDLDSFITELMRSSSISRDKIIQFIAFDKNNPTVWALYQRFTKELIYIGHEHHSSDAVLHRVRWEAALQTIDSSAFKINNNYTAFYARKFHAVYPEYGNFFRLRRSCADQMVPVFKQEAAEQREEAEF